MIIVERLVSFMSFFLQKGFAKTARNLWGGLLLASLLFASADLHGQTWNPGTANVAVIDSEMDLAFQLEAVSPEIGQPPVPPAPRLVTAQGELAQNQTVVRILNQWGIAEAQFLAYPASVTGGVRVSAGNLFGGAFSIAACPISDTSTREVRIFDQDSLRRASWEPPSDMAAPFVLEVADFYGGARYDEIGLAGRYPTAGSASDIVILNGEGDVQVRRPAPISSFAPGETLHLSRYRGVGGDFLLLQYMVAGRLFLMSARTGLVKEISPDDLAAGVRSFESAFLEETLVAGGDHPSASTLYAVEATDAPARSLDVGARENLFHVHPIAGAESGQLLYDFDDSIDGWTANGAAVCNISHENDHMVFTYLNGSPFDPYATGPVANYDGDTLQEFAAEITVENGPAAGADCAVYWLPQSGGAGRALFNITNGTQIVRVNLADSAAAGSAPHTGAISRIRLDLPEAGTYADFSGATVRINWVAVSDDPAYAPNSAVYSFDDSTDGWGINSSSCALSSEEGQMVLTYLDASPFDPYVNGPIENYNGDTLQEFAAEITVENGPAGGANYAVYWLPQSGGTGRALFNLTNGTQVVRLNLANSAADGSMPHTGTISRIRLDLPESLDYAGFAEATVRVNWLAVTDDPAYTPGDSPWGEYVRKGLFRHLRTDANSPAYSADPDFDNTDYEYWTGGILQNYINATQADYATNVPSVWEPTASHRQFPGAFDGWKAATDTATGLPKYMALTRLNNLASYTEVGNTFEVMTWSPGLPALERLIVWPMREYLLNLAPKFRARPDRMIALEPNHEFEIHVAGDSSVGDYNPAMIEAFRDYVMRRYNTLDKVNARFGTSWASVSEMDAPRNQGRGAWDGYSTSVAWFNEWVNFERRVVSFRILQGLREALLAGFPPQILTTHQIPADYVVGPASGGRITPIEWTLANGCGYGGTRYGVWYDDTENWIQGAKSSGHDTITVGEYHPLTTNQSDATAQLQYMFDNGVNFIHHMFWDDPALDPIGAQAYLTLRDTAGARPGVTGGVGQIRAVYRHSPDWPEARYNIVQVGSGQNRGGVLKSVTSEGKWEGSVYVQPFHAHVEVTPFVAETEMTIADMQWAGGPVGGLRTGDQIEISFQARSSDVDPRLTVLLLHDGVELGGHRDVMVVGNDWRSYRWIVRIQNPMDGIMPVINSGVRDTPTGSAQTIEMRDFRFLVHKERIARMVAGESAGTAHRGGVTFDVLSDDYVGRGGDYSDIPAGADGWHIFE